MQSLAAGGRPVLVFSEYGDTVRYLRDRLLPSWGNRLAVYTGDGGERWTGTTWQPVQKAAITAALDRGEISVLLCTDAASEGLNLQAAGALVNYDLPWNPSRVEQRIGRIDRIGQQHATLPIRNFFLPDSIDRRVYQVLNARCGLFETFVGPMQPVLSDARRLLMRRVPAAQLEGEIARLEARASEAERDILAQSVYTPSDEAALADLATGAPAPQPAPADRAALSAGLALLSAAELGISAIRLDDGAWQVTEPSGTAVVALDSPVLDAREAAQPLGPGTPLWQTIAGLLGPAPEDTPLVIARAGAAKQPTRSAPPADRHNAGYQATAAAAPFEAREVRWIHPAGKTLCVHSAAELRVLLDEWDGTAPAADAFATGRVEATAAAAARVAHAARQADGRQRAALSSQVEAARLRLRHTTARALEAVQPAQPWNTTWQHQLSRPGATPRWLEALQRLGDHFPTWTHDELRLERADVGRLRPAGREGLTALSEVIAALEDPRWAAEGTLATLQS